MGVFPMGLLLSCSFCGSVLALDNATKAEGKEICVTGHESFPMERADRNQALTVDRQSSNDADCKIANTDLIGYAVVLFFVSSKKMMH